MTFISRDKYLLLKDLENTKKRISFIESVDDIFNLETGIITGRLIG